MKYTACLFLFLITAMGTGCQDLKCPAFDETERNNWLPQEAGGTVTFEQEADHSTVTFAVKQVKVTEAYREKSRGIYGPKDCEASARIEMIVTDASVVMKPGYSLSIEDKDQRRDLSYHLGDFSASFQTYPLLSMPNTEPTQNMERDSIISTLILGGKTYNNVVVQSRNPLDTLPYQIQKVYFASGHGLIGFVSRSRLYYRK